MSSVCSSGCLFAKLKCFKDNLSFTLGFFAIYGIAWMFGNDIQYPAFTIPSMQPLTLIFQELIFQWIFLIWECTQPMGYFFWKSYSWRIYVICSQIKLMIVTSLIKVVGASNESEEEQLFSSTNLSMNKTLHDQVKVILLYKQKIYIS